MFFFLIRLNVYFKTTYNTIKGRLQTEINNENMSLTYASNFNQVKLKTKKRTMNRVRVGYMDKYCIYCILFKYV